MSRHTPGPWALDESRHEGSINRMDPFRHIGMVSQFQYDHTSQAENLANARLIAAAPDLLEALMIMVSAAYPVSTEIESKGHRWSQAYLDEALPIARAAIAKAKGEQQ